MPELLEFLDAIVSGEVDCHILAVIGGLEWFASCKPGHRIEEACIAAVRSDVVFIAEGVNLLGRLVVVIPCLDLLAVHAGLVEDLLVVEEGHGACVDWQCVHLAVYLH